MAVPDSSHDDASGANAPASVAPPASTAAPDREAELERALSEGRLDHLPPNQPRGILGERNPELRVEEDFTPDLNEGVSREMSWPVERLLIFLAFVFFFPLAYVLVWRSKNATFEWKVTVTIATAVFIAYVAYRMLVR